MQMALQVQVMALKISSVKCNNAVDDRRMN